MIDEKAIIPAGKTFIPEVVDETGKKIVGPELEAVTQLVTQLASLAQLARIRKSLEKEEFEGKIDDRTLNANDQLQYIDLIKRHPNTPWATAFCLNDGPNSVYITINDVYPTTPIRIAEGASFDYIKADRRVEVLYYWCDPGNTASVRVKGKY